jgi:uracil-DNA glycosylase
MLNQENGQLSRWLKGILGAENFQLVTLYATNLVKCSFMNPPSRSVEGGLRFLKPYFDHCKEHLAAELLSFKPNCVLTLGEPTHKLFINMLDNQDEMPETMQAAFTGQFLRAKFKGIEFDYSPCLHIQTFRVAETYGERVQKFKKGISSYFSKSQDNE